MMPTIRKIQVYIFGTILFTTALHSYAATEAELQSRIEERQREIATLEEEIAVYQETLSKTSEKSQTLQNQVSRIETQIKKLSTDIRLTENRITAAELHMEELDNQITKSEARIERQRKTLAKTLQAIYQEDADSIIELLLKNGQFSDFFGQLENIHKLEESIHKDMAEIRSLKTVLQNERDSRASRRTELSDLQKELYDRKKIEENTKNSKAALLAVTKNEETRYQELLAEREAIREQMLDEIQKIEDELRRRIDPSAIPEAKEGVLSWPLRGSIALTQSFGITPDSKILYNGKPHNGIDFKASIGTPIYAADSGPVLETGDTDAYTGCLSYGKWILIKHENNLATLYAHLSQISVGKGTSVLRGDLIGYTGATGYATGPHLHFTVYDASTVQFQSSKVPGSTCKLLPYGGYLNPLAYL
jgi:murein DD-endopeptidase MepM/ murein hydrolase activator NlpD